MHKYEQIESTDRLYHKWITLQISLGFCVPQLSKSISISCCWWNERGFSVFCVILCAWLMLFPRPFCTPPRAKSWRRHCKLGSRVERIAIISIVVVVVWLWRNGWLLITHVEETIREKFIVGRRDNRSHATRRNENVIHDKDADRLTDRDCTVMPISHRRPTRRDATKQFCRVGSWGVKWELP